MARETSEENGPGGGEETAASAEEVLPEGLYERVRQKVLDRARIPLSTYRVQLNKSFRFEDARAQVAYWDRLGVSDLYASPYLKAAPGSTHGYDVVDHQR